MKKILLLIAFVMQVAFVFAQTKEINKKGYGMATGGFKPNRQEIPTTPKSINNNNQSYKNDCYTNLAFTVKNYGYNKDGKFYSWGVSVKNNYSKPVQIRYKLIVGNDRTSPCAKYGTLTYYIKPGESYTNDFGTLKALIVDNNSEQYRIEVSEVCFEGQDCIKNGYADCNGKQSSSSENNAPKITTNTNKPEKFNVITTQKLLATLKIRNADKLEIFKKYFIQEGYKYIGEGECESFFDGTLQCLKFSNFSIYQNKKGMFGITFGGNVVLMEEIKNKLNAIKNTFVENEFNDNGKITECDITFNQGELEFYFN